MNKCISTFVHVSVGTHSQMCVYLYACLYVCVSTVHEHTCVRQWRVGEDDRAVFGWNKPLKLQGVIFMKWNNPLKMSLVRHQGKPVNRYFLNFSPRAE